MTIPNNDPSPVVAELKLARQLCANVAREMHLHDRNVDIQWSREYLEGEFDNDPEVQAVLAAISTPTPSCAEPATPATLGQTERTIAERTQAEMNDVAEAEREACIRILEDLRPTNDRSDWTEWALIRDDVLRSAICRINARYPA